jgi:hypothetical protein
LSETKEVRGRGRPKGTGKFDGQRFTVRLPQDLVTRLMDRARGRVDFQSNHPDKTHADSDARGMASSILREALEHYLDGCDREVQEPPAPAKATKPKATTTTRARKPAKAAKG